MPSEQYFLTYGTLSALRMASLAGIAADETESSKGTR